MRHATRRGRRRQPEINGLRTIRTELLRTTGDKLGIYILLFAAQSGHAIAVMGEMFVLMTALSCAVAHWLVYHPTLGAPIRRYGRRIMPFVLINLGLPTFLTPGLPAVLSCGRNLVGCGARTAGRLVAPGPHRLPGLGTRSDGVSHCSGSVLSGGSRRGRCAGDRGRPQLAQPAAGRAGDRPRHRQFADALGGQRRSRTGAARVASRTRHRDRADLGDGGSDRAELYPELAREAPGRRSPRRPGLDRSDRARRPARWPVRLGVLSGFARGRPAPSAWRGAQSLAPAAVARRPRSRCFWFSMSAMLGSRSVRRCSACQCSTPICRKAPPSTR
jgi:hypothetical protein